jgi:hypothetical protein
MGIAPDRIEPLDNLFKSAIADSLILAAVSRLEIVEQFHVATEHATQGSTAIEEMQRSLSAKAAHLVERGPAR